MERKDVDIVKKMQYILNIEICLKQECVFQ